MRWSFGDTRRLTTKPEPAFRLTNRPNLDDPLRKSVEISQAVIDYLLSRYASLEPESREADPSVPTKAIPSLTGIRGMAACWVLAYHTQLVGNEFLPSIFGGRIFLVRDGWTGVDLFFVLSGFILMHAHDGAFATIDRPTLWAFARARAYRVLPLSFIVLLLVTLLVFIDADFAAWYAGSNAGNLSLWSWIKTAMLATRWGLPGRGEWNDPIWSLSVEVLAYLAFPLLAMIAQRSRGFVVPLVGAGACMAAVMLAENHIDQLGENLINNKWAMIRVAGFFTAGLLLRRAAGLAPAGIARAMPLLAIAALLALPVLGAFKMGPGIMPIAFAALIFALYFRCGVVSSLLETKLSLFLGKISFPVYLAHLMPLIVFNFTLSKVAPTPLEYAGYYCLFLIGLIALCWILHRYVERPVLNFSHHGLRKIGGEVGYSRKRSNMLAPGTARHE